MTVTKQGARIVIFCNGENCNVVRQDQEGQHAKWRKNSVVWKEAQDAGWTARSKNEGRDWDHFCPGCRERVG